MNSRCGVLVVLIALFALAAGPATWARTSAAPDAGQVPALAPASSAAQAPADTLATPDPQAQTQLQIPMPALPALSGIPGIHTGQRLGCGVAACEDFCPLGGHFGSDGFCECC